MIQQLVAAIILIVGLVAALLGGGNVGVDLGNPVGQAVYLVHYPHSAVVHVLPQGLKLVGDQIHMLAQPAAGLQNTEAGVAVFGIIGKVLPCIPELVQRY